MWSDKGFVGVACTHDRSQARDSSLSLVRAISEAVGPAMRTQVTLAECGSRGTSTATHLYDLERCRYVHSGRGLNYHCFGVKAEEKSLPLARRDAVQSAWRAAQVRVEWGFKARK